MNTDQISLKVRLDRGLAKVLSCYSVVFAGAGIIYVFRGELDGAALMGALSAVISIYPVRFLIQDRKRKKEAAMKLVERVLEDL